MKIIISPDSFKGSLTATEAADEIANGIREIDSSIETVLLPVADGGEGTLESLLLPTHGQFVVTQVRDPLGRLIQARYGILGDGVTCVIEMAKVSGLMLLKEHEKDPIKASTYGTGELIRHALDSGYRKFIVGIGGSATNDGGAGMLQALGMSFQDKQGHELPLGAGELEDLAVIDTSNFDMRIQESNFVIASDVDNPYVGPNGATAIFGPQKGVTNDLVQTLDRNLTHLANKIEALTGVSLHNEPGAGAAGGLGGAFLAFFPVEMKPGIKVVMEAIDFHRHIEGADYIVTGEGKSDLQTLSGKAPFGIAQIAKERQIPVILLSGYIEPESITRLSPFFTEIVSVVDSSVSLEESMRNAGYYLRMKAKEIMCSVIRK